MTGEDKGMVLSVSPAFVVISSGQDVQRASVIVNLPNLVRQNPAETFRRVVPKVRVGQILLQFILLSVHH